MKCYSVFAMTISQLLHHSEVEAVKNKKKKKKKSM